MGLFRYSNKACPGTQVTRDGHLAATHGSLPDLLKERMDLAGPAASLYSPSENKCWRFGSGSESTQHGDEAP
jgi:hypothetical protein